LFKSFFGIPKIANDWGPTDEPFLANNNMNNTETLLSTQSESNFFPTFAHPVQSEETLHLLQQHQHQQQRQQKYMDAQPTPDLAPEQVIEIQLDALQNCDVPTKDKGIEIAFRFASPANKAATGPLSRFARMIHSPLYRCMTNFKRAKFEPHNMRGDEWKISIFNDVNGAEVVSVFIWRLSRQTTPPVKDCWMTDSVLKIN
jgi:hypothetical protein